ncbi:uncharacterized protein isoform X4 [Macaca fascicularis]|uniref:uncharacterized protein isoform X4 n=1 Tax=Macaca fascicularis TaxID=9541 RepID=UPI003D15CEF0
METSYYVCWTGHRSKDTGELSASWHKIQTSNSGTFLTQGPTHGGLCVEPRCFMQQPQLSSQQMPAPFAIHDKPPMQSLVLRNLENVDINCSLSHMESCIFCRLLVGVQLRLGAGGHFGGPLKIQALRSKTIGIVGEQARHRRVELWTYCKPHP